MIRPLIILIGLVAAWCGLWGSVSAANVLSGLVVGAIALLVGNGWRGRGSVRLLPLLHLTWIVLVDLALSTWSVVHEVLTPTDYTDEAVVAVALPPGGERHLLLLFVAITVTPGTAVVCASDDASTLYLHLLHAERRDEIDAHVKQLAAVAARALPSAPAAAESNRASDGAFATEEGS